MRIFFVVLCLLSFSLSGCSSVDNSEETKEVGLSPELNCIAVLPIEVPATNNGTLTTAQKKNLQEGASFLDSVMSEELAGREQFEILTGNQIDAILSDPWGGRLQQVRAIGRATGCGAVLETSLSQYRQRVGGTMSAETPAAVAFSMQMIDAEKGVVLWATAFKESQKALFEDLFSYSKAESRGFKWLTVEELSRDGMKNRLSKLPSFLTDDE
ncbi:MAG: hypothetical protein U9R57_10675 [Thermodesulfobacteriota bacterium]|nr:hypothetical protein [Thermodesulfobacteriota bacterium]